MHGSTKVNILNYILSLDVLKKITFNAVSSSSRYAKIPAAINIIVRHRFYTYENMYTIVKKNIKT